VLLACKVFRALLVLPAPLEFKEYRDLQVLQELQELLVQPVFRVFRGLQVSQVLLVPKEIKDLQESLAQRDPKDLLE
jgi:hypothetical protein